MLGSASDERPTDRKSCPSVSVSPVFLTTGTYLAACTCNITRTGVIVLSYQA
jgi:hypothetical protein